MIVINKCDFTNRTSDDEIFEWCKNNNINTFIKTDCITSEGIDILVKILFNI